MDCTLNIDAVQGILDNELLDSPGEFIYSAVNTLKAGELYILGTNPGEVRIPSKYPTIREQIQNLPNKNFNHYHGNEWALENAQKVHKQTSPVGKKLENIIAKLQRGYSLSEVCASNLIFLRTKDLKEMSSQEFEDYAMRCWPAHQMILDIIQPKAILVFGNSAKKSPYAILQKLLPNLQTGNFPSGHGKLLVHWFQSQIQERPVTIFGVPHLSRFSLSNTAINQMTRMIAE